MKRFAKFLLVLVLLTLPAYATNSYYNHSSGAPATGSLLSSAVMRGEFDSVAAGFNLLPTLAGANNLPVFVNSSGTALDAIPAATAQSLLGLGVLSTLTPPVPISDGGTGAATSAAAFSNIVGGTTVPITEGGTGSTTAAAAQTALGLGSVAPYNVGTSGGTVPLLDDGNLWSGAQVVSQVTLTYAATINTNANLGNVFLVTLAGNAVLANPANVVAGGSYIWNINQDATGGRTLTYGTMFKFPGGVAPTLTTAANAADSLFCLFDGTILRCSLTANYQ